MKGSGKILFCVVVLSLLFLFHVHEQIVIFKVSYRLNEKSDLLAQRSEEYRRLKYEVDQLKAPRLLEEKIKERSMDLTMPKEVRVVRMPAALDRTIQKQAAPDLSLKPSITGKFMNFLGRWIEVAQAKTDN